MAAVGYAFRILPALGNPGRKSRSSKDNATNWEAIEGKVQPSRDVQDL